MSDNREIQEEQEAWGREENELIPRRGIHLHREGSEDETKQQQAKTTEDWYKGKRIKGEKKRFSHGNKRKMLKKVKQILFSPLRRLENHLGSSKEKISASSTRRCSYRFPYDGEEYGGRRSSHLCFGSSHPTVAASPIHLGTGYSNEAPGNSSAEKPKSQSYYTFVKALIEKNDFSSPVCNVHRDIFSSNFK